MSISKFPAERKPAFIPAGASGSYAFPNPVDAGMYLLETDTTQNISSTNLYVETSEGFRVGAAVRGGRGYISIPVTADAIYINSGTFPLPVTVTAQDYSLIDAPSASFTEYVSGSLEVLVALPSGATDWNLFWPDGTSASYSGSAASIAIPGGLTFPLSVGVSAYDANAVLGRITSDTLNQSFFTFLSSSAFVPPPGAVSADVYLLGGGGGAAGGSSPGDYAAVGGGGGGEYAFVPAVPLSGSVSVVVGAGGAGVTGVTSTFGSASAAGGVGATFSANNGTPGGASGSGNPGGVHSNGGFGSHAGGGGGGHTASGGAATTAPGPAFVIAGNGGAGQPATVFGITVGGGGGGGAAGDGAGPTAVGVDGGGNGSRRVSSGASGGSSGAVNRGGGGGGPAVYGNSPTGAFTVGASSGGSGRVLVKVNYS